MSTTAPIPTSPYFKAGDRPRAPELRQVLQTGSPALLAALYAVPGFREADEALWRFDRYRTHVLDIARDVGGEGVADSIAKMIADDHGGDLDPDTFLSEVEAMLRRRELDTMAQDLLAAVVARLWELRTAVLQTREGERAVIRSLNLQLAALLAPLHKLGVQDADLDSSIAIDGRVQQYEALREALAMFDDILTAIRTWHAAAGVGGGVPHYWLACLIPDPQAVDPLVGVALIDAYAWNPISGETYDGTPWPEADDETNRGRLLIWLAQRTDISSHLPTVAQWQTRDKQLREAKNEAVAAAAGATRIVVTRRGRLISKDFRPVPDSQRRTITVPTGAADSPDDWQVRRRDPPRVRVAADTGVARGRAPSHGPHSRTPREAADRSADTAHDHRHTSPTLHPPAARNTRPGTGGRRHLLRAARVHTGCRGPLPRALHPTPSRSGDRCARKSGRNHTRVASLPKIAATLSVFDRPNRARSGASMPYPNEFTVITSVSHAAGFPMCHGCGVGPCPLGEAVRLDAGAARLWHVQSAETVAFATPHPVSRTMDRRAALSFAAHSARVGRPRTVTTRLVLIDTSAVAPMTDHKRQRETPSRIGTRRTARMASLLVFGCESASQGLQTQSTGARALPRSIEGTTLPKIVSLFSGAGGLDLGFRQAGFEVAFATDQSKWAMQTHAHNFPETASETADLVKIGAAGLVERVKSHVSLGASIGVIGGPPCQGFSRANTNAVADDPRNRLPMLYLEVVEALSESFTVEFILFENVLGIRDSKHAAVFNELLDKLSDMGFSKNVSEYCAADFGVPQNRRRIIVSAFSSNEEPLSFEPEKVERIDDSLSVRSAIEGLPEPTYFTRGLSPDAIPHHPNHWTMRPVSDRFRTPDVVHANARSFRRLAWDKPSPTVAYGHREIHVHPSGHRRLSIYEAMILQGFTADFELKGPLSAQVEQVSNAVPPPLARRLADAVRKKLESRSDVQEGSHLVA